MRTIDDTITLFLPDPIQLPAPIIAGDMDSPAPSP